MKAVQIEAIRSAKMSRAAARDFVRATTPLLRQVETPELYRFVSPSVIAELRRYYRDGNEWVRKTFFPDREAPLFRSAIPDSYEEADSRLLHSLAAKLIDAHAAARLHEC